MKHWFHTLCVLLLLGVVSTGCSSDTKEEDSGDTKPVTEENRGDNSTTQASPEGDSQISLVKLSLPGMT